MDTLVWILIIVGVVLVVALVAWAVYRRLQSQRLRRRFGPEYERAMDRTGGDRKEAESALGDRVSRREQLELRPLSPAARDTYMRRWELAQAEFVDEPGAAVEHAQALLDEVMAERGYPVRDEFEERADLISVDHPDVVEHYRQAHRLHIESRQAGDGAVATEERRQALVHYRALFTGLLEVEPAGGPATDSPDDDDDELKRQRRAS
jgi:hypothetical protein